MIVNDSREFVVSTAEPEGVLIRRVFLSDISMSEQGEPSVHAIVTDADLGAIETARQENAELESELRAVEQRHLSAEELTVERGLIADDWIDNGRVVSTYIFPETIAGKLLQEAKKIATGIALWDPELKSALVDGPDLVNMDIAKVIKPPSVLKELTLEERVDYTHQKIKVAQLAGNLALYLESHYPQ